VEVEDPMEAVVPTPTVDLMVTVDQVVLTIMEEVDIMEGVDIMEEADPMDLVGLIHRMEVFLAHPLETVVGDTISQEVPPTLT